MPDSSHSGSRVTEDLEAIDAALGGRPVDTAHQPWGDLAVALRDERAGLDEEAARRLDERFERSSRDFRGRDSTGARRRGMRSTLSSGRRTWWPALAAVACLLLAVVVVFDELRVPVDSGQDAAGGATEVQEIGEAALPAGRAASGAAADSAASQAAAPARELAPGGVLSDPTDGRERRLVERSAFLVLTSEPNELADVASRIVRTTDDVGGYVASSTVGESTDRRASASFELRVPARELPRTLAALSRLAQVTERGESTRDVTADAGRISRRIAELRAERRRLLRALERAESAREAARIRERLRVVARRTAATRTARRRLRNRAAFATIGVELLADADAGAAVGDGRWSPGDAVQTAIRVLEVAVGVALVAAALALPLALVVALVALVGRVAARRRRARVLDAR